MRPVLSRPGLIFALRGDSQFHARRTALGYVMTPDEFARLALGLGPNVVARPILETIQMQIGGKTFATIGWPAEGWAVVKLDPLDQAWGLRLSDALTAEPGRRRKAGIVLARLAGLDVGAAAELLAAAWRNAHRRSASSARRGVLAPLRAEQAA